MKHIEETNLEIIYENWQVPVLHYTKSCQLSSCIPGIEMQTYLPSNEQLPLFQEEIARNELPIYLEDTKNTFYIGYSDTESGFYLLGSFSVIPLNEMSLRTFRHHHKISKSEIVPAVIDFKDSCQLMLLSCYLLTNRHYSPIDISRDTISALRTASDMTLYQLDTGLTERKRISYNFELQWLKSIQDGTYNLEHVPTSPFSSFSDEVGVMAKNDQKKQMEYTYLSGIVLASRAAMRGGLPPHIAYPLSDVILQQLGESQNVFEMNTIFFNGIDSFVHMLQDTRKSQNYNTYVEECIDYVGSHIHSKFTIQELADHLNVNVTYLSRTFSASMHMTLHQYIVMQRLIASQNLLRFSPSSIGEIAEYLCFSSASHFSSCFTREFGITPSTYRSRNRISNSSAPFPHL